VNKPDGHTKTTCFAGRLYLLFCAADHYYEAFRLRILIHSKDRRRIGRGVRLARRMLAEIRTPPRLVGAVWTTRISEEEVMMVHRDSSLRLELVQTLQVASWPDLPRRYTLDNGKTRRPVVSLVIPSPYLNPAIAAGCSMCPINAEFARHMGAQQ
jgi:hypothetical protein